MIQANIRGETPTQWADLSDVYSYWRAVIRAEPRLQVQIEACNAAFSDVSLVCPVSALSSIFTSPPRPYPSQSSRIQVYTSSSRKPKSNCLVIEYADYQFTSSPRGGVDDTELVLETPILDADKGGSGTEFLRPIWLGFAFPAGITELCIRSPSTGPIAPVPRLQDLLDILEWLPSLRHLVIVDVQPLPHHGFFYPIRRRLRLPRLRSISMDGMIHQCAFLATHLSLCCISFINFRLHRNAGSPEPGWLGSLISWTFGPSFLSFEGTYSPIIAIQVHCRRIGDQFELELCGWNAIVARLNEETSNKDQPLPSHRLVFPLGGRRSSPSAMVCLVCSIARPYLRALEEFTLCGSSLLSWGDELRPHFFDLATTLKRIKTIGHPALILPNYLSKVMGDGRKVHPMLREVVIIPSTEECPERDGCCIQTRTYWSSLARCLSERKQAGFMLQLLELRGPSYLKTEIDDPGVVEALTGVVGEFRCTWY